MADDIEDYRVGPEVAPLHAEIARLKSELAKAQAELAVWQSTFGTRQNHAEDVEKLKAENARLADDNRAWRTQEAHLLSKVGEVQEKMDRALSRKGILDLRNQLEATKRELLDAQGKALILKAENARLAAEWALSLNANRPLALSREELGKKVREVWIRWAQSQPSPKTHWLLPWSALAESDREVDRMIGEEIARWSLLADASLRAARGEK